MDAAAYNRRVGVNGVPRPRDFAQVDVFSPIPYLGNQVAVVLDGGDLDDETMLRVARWTNLSETTFLLPPTTAAADYRVRIFCPEGEVPFAGHPTLGSAHAWLEHGGAMYRADCVVQECGVGLVEVRRGDGILSFAAPPTRRTGELDEAYVDDIVRAFGITRDRVLAHQWVDNGPGWAVVQLASAAEVLQLEPDLAQIPAAMVGALGAYPAGSANAFELRTFAPGVGLTEDPICGSMNASVGQWLLRSGQVSTGYTVSQGTRLGRAGQVTITVDESGQVWCGGATTTCLRGVAIL
jgi:PhzF family phenazine biosynthesis protein